MRFEIVTQRYVIILRLKTLSLIFSSSNQLDYLTGISLQLLTRQLWFFASSNLHSFLYRESQEQIEKVKGSRIFRFARSLRQEAIGSVHVLKGSFCINFAL